MGSIILSRSYFPKAYLVIKQKEKHTTAGKPLAKIGCRLKTPGVSVYTRKFLNKPRGSVVLIAGWVSKNNAVWLLDSLTQDDPRSSITMSLGRQHVRVLVLSFHHIYGCSPSLTLDLQKFFYCLTLLWSFKKNLCLLAYLFLIAPVIYKSVLVIKYSNNIEVYKVKSKLSTSSFPLPEVITVISLVYSFSRVFSLNLHTFINI